MLRVLSSALVTWRKFCARCFVYASVLEKDMRFIPVTLHMAVFVQSTFLTLTVHAGIPHKCMFLSAFYYLLLSCILATKPVRGICGVSWTTGGGGGGATDTGATTIRQAEGAAERQRATEVFGQGERQKTQKQEQKGITEKRKSKLSMLKKKEGRGDNKKLVSKQK